MDWSGHLMVNGYPILATEQKGQILMGSQFEKQGKNLQRIMLSIKVLRLTSDLIPLLIATSADIIG
jgi:hypothetical protein